MRVQCADGGIAVLAPVFGRLVISLACPMPNLQSAQHIKPMHDWGRAVAAGAWVKLSLSTDIKQHQSSSCSSAWWRLWCHSICAYAVVLKVEKSPKPVASCAMPAGPGMKIKTDTPLVKKAREGVMEFLLVRA
jgi:hypothetical protein